MALLKWRHDAYLNALALHLVEGDLRDAKLFCQSNFTTEKSKSQSKCGNTFG